MTACLIPDRRTTFIAGAVIGLGLALASKAHAAGTCMPW